LSIRNAALAATKTAPQRAQRTQRFFFMFFVPFVVKKNFHGRDNFFRAILQQSICKTTTLDEVHDGKMCKLDD
jgi:hypothetical protein